MKLRACLVDVVQIWVKSTENEHFKHVEAAEHYSLHSSASFGSRPAFVLDAATLGCATVLPRRNRRFSHRYSGLATVFLTLLTPWCFLAFTPTFAAALASADPMNGVTRIGTGLIRGLRANAQEGVSIPVVFLKEPFNDTLFNAHADQLGVQSTGRRPKMQCSLSQSRNLLGHDLLQGAWSETPAERVHLVRSLRQLVARIERLQQSIVTLNPHEVIFLHPRTSPDPVVSGAVSSVCMSVSTTPPSQSMHHLPATSTSPRTFSNERRDPLHRQLRRRRSVHKLLLHRIVSGSTTVKPHRNRLPRRLHHCPATNTRASLQDHFVCTSCITYVLYILFFHNFASHVIPNPHLNMAELTVKVVSGTSENLHLQGLDLATTTVQKLKTLIQQQNPRRFPVSAQRLIFQGQILQDAKLLTDYHVASGCALHLTLTPGAVAAANAAADRAAASAGPAPPVQLRSYLQQMRDQEPYDMYATAVRTLQKICSNIVDHPTEDKYRRLRVDNAALKAKLFDRTRGQESCKLIGFQDGVQAVSGYSLQILDERGLTRLLLLVVVGPLRAGAHAREVGELGGVQGRRGLVRDGFGRSNAGCVAFWSGTVDGWNGRSWRTGRCGNGGRLCCAGAGFAPEPGDAAANDQQPHDAANGPAEPHAGAGAAEPGDAHAVPAGAAAEPRYDAADAADDERPERHGAHAADDGWGWHGRPRRVWRLSFRSSSTGGRCG
jgi:hypothetical protein